MSALSIFLDLTTEKALSAIEAEAATYDGLYVDMNDSKQRKYVKGKAAVINELLKKLERARIDKAKNYKLSIESEAGDIKARLEAANTPFTLLIDKYAEERAKVLAEEKRIQEEELAAIQLDKDHDAGIQLNRLFDLEVKEAIAVKAAEDQAKIEHDNKIAEDAANQAREEAAQLIVKQQQESKEREAAAIQAQLDTEAQAQFDAEQAEFRLKKQAEQAELDKQAAIAAEVNRQQSEAAEAKADARNREANKDHKRAINNEAMQCFVKGGLSKESAKLAVTLLAKRAIEHAVINY